MGSARILDVYKLKNRRVFRFMPGLCSARFYLLTLCVFLLIIISDFNNHISYSVKNGEYYAKKNISAPQTQGKEKTRFFKPHVHAHGQERDQKTAQKRPEGTDEVLNTVRSLKF